MNQKQILEKLTQCVILLETVEVQNVDAEVTIIQVIVKLEKVIETLIERTEK